MLYTQLVLRVRLVVVELVDAYRREHRVEDRELTRGESSDPARGGGLGAARRWRGSDAGNHT